MGNSCTSEKSVAVRRKRRYKVYKNYNANTNNNGRPLSIASSKTYTGDNLSMVSKETHKSVHSVVSSACSNHRSTCVLSFKSQFTLPIDQEETHLDDEIRSEDGTLSVMSSYTIYKKSPDLKSIRLNQRKEKVKPVKKSQPSPKRSTNSNKSPLITKKESKKSIISEIIKFKNEEQIDFPLSDKNRSKASIKTKSSKSDCSSHEAISNLVIPFNRYVTNVSNEPLFKDIHGVLWLTEKEIVNHKLNKDDFKFVYNGKDAFCIDKCMRTAYGIKFLIAFRVLSHNNELKAAILPQNQDKKHLLEYKFNFCLDNTWNYVHVSNKLPMRISDNRIRPLFYQNSYQNIDLLTAHFEKACAKLLGSYDELKKISIHDAIMCLNNGIYDIYRLELIDNLMRDNSKVNRLKQECLDFTKKLRQTIPSFERLFEIIKLALKRKFVLRLCTDKSSRIEIDAKNDYFLIDYVDSSKLFKCFNYRLMFSKSKFREKNLSFAEKPLEPSEFLISYTDLLKIFDYLIVYNLNPQDECEKKSDSYRLVTTIGNKWTFQEFKRKFALNKDTLKSKELKNEINSFEFNNLANVAQKLVLCIYFDRHIIKSKIEIRIYRFDVKWELYTWSSGQSNKIQINCNFNPGRYKLFIILDKQTKNKDVNYVMRVHVCSELADKVKINETNANTNEMSDYEKELKRMPINYSLIFD